jgi:mono/diheme cytochrome c family protein
MRGFDLFRQRCLRCHAIDGQGGRIGPDLNAPQSITSYRSETMIKAFIQRPSQFRHSKMPDHTDLSAAQLDELYRYLWAKGHAPMPR